MEDCQASMASLRVERSRRSWDVRARWVDSSASCWSCVMCWKKRMIAGDVSERDVEEVVVERRGV